MREVQNFSFTGTKLPRYVNITIIIIGCPVNDYGHGPEFLDELVQVRNAKRPIIDHYLQLITALLEKGEGETKLCGQTGYQTHDP